MARDDYVKYTVKDYIDLDKKIIYKINNFFDGHRKIYIYGAGDIGKRVRIFLNQHGELEKKVSGYVVSERKDSDDELHGITIYQFDEIDFTCAGVLLALSYEHHKSIVKKLKNSGCSEILSFDEYEYTHIYWSNHHLTKRWIDFLKEKYSVKKVLDFDIKSCNSVLLICTDSIGDEVINIPFIRELRNNLISRAKITIVVQPAVAQFMKKCPYVDKILIYDAKLNSGYDVEESSLKSRLYAEKNLQSEDYDVVILHGWFSVRLEYFFLAMFSSAKIRIGFSEHNMSHKEYCNMGYDQFFSLAIKSTSVMNEVERDIKMLSAIGGTVYSNELEFWTENKDIDFAEFTFRSNKCENCRVIAIVPTAADGARMWPREKYAMLIKRILDVYSDVTCLLLGGSDSIKVCKEITEYVNSNRIIDFSGKTNLCEVAEILKRCFLYLGCDTGLLHIAAAVKLRTLQIICHSEEGDPLEYPSLERYRAWGNESYFVRPKKALPGCGATCYMRRSHCIEQISVDDVFDVVNNVLGCEDKC